MNDNWFSSPPAGLASEGFAAHVLPTAGALAEYCRGLVAVEVAPSPDVMLDIVPHDSFVLSLQMARGRDPFSRGVERGGLAHFCGFREEALNYRPGGDCLTFFALLTPQGAIAASAGQALDDKSPVRRPLAALMDRAPLVQLEDRIARQADAPAMLGAFGSWLEEMLVPRRTLPWQARRAARIASRMMSEPSRTVQSVADEEGVNRRQLERDFRRWLDTSPKHAGAVARVQAVARMAASGVPLAHTAASLGFTDQPHMNRAVKQVTGISPLGLARTARTALSAAFRRVTGGGVVYL